jgi:radical SAM superfamily enzyme YgiQ (UPF0313 family)
MPDTFYAMRHLMRITGTKAAYPPLGLLTVASLIPEDWFKKLVDLNVTALDDKDLDWADYVFLSAMNVQEDSVREIVIRCSHAGVKIVAGGSLFTHEHERFPDIDYFVLNEAEITLPLFLDDLQKGDPQPIYRTTEFADMAQSPIPALDLVNMDNYLYSIIQYSRGCPHMCDFCDVTTLYGRRPRIKDTAQIINELDEINRHSNVRSVLFADDNLIGNKRMLKDELLPALIKWRKEKRPGFLFATQLTIDLADDESLMSLMIDAGFRQIFIGIETPDEEGLKASGKKQNLKRNQLESIRKLHKSGFFIAAGFIVGFDTDTQSIFQRQIDFIQESGIALPIVNILKAPPGTELFKRLKNENRLSKQFAFAEGDTNIIPVMEEKALYDGYIQLITNIYHPEKSYQRLIQFFSTYESPKTSVRVPAKYSSKDISLVFRAFYFLGIKDPHRKFFWKLIFWSIMNKRKYLDMALFYGIMIYQMHQTSVHIIQSVNENMRLMNRTSKVW